VCRIAALTPFGRLRLRTFDFPEDLPPEFCHFHNGESYYVLNWRG
jgi:hypothetical protein